MNQESIQPVQEGSQAVKARRRGRIRRWLRRIAFCLFLLLAATVGLSALSNLLLPSHSSTIERLSDLDKARLLEVSHLRRTLGDALWPGWGSATIPFIQYNEQYAFLVNYPTPPAGWRRMPQRLSRGGPWEPVPSDTFDGETYYRQLLSDANIRPEAFTVLVGERWVASMTTKQWTHIGLGNEMRKDLPGALKHIVPYRAFGRLLNSDWHICGLLHESFHAYQGMSASERLAEGEMSMNVTARYPWEEPVSVDAWQKELNLLADALQASSGIEMTMLARQFLDERRQRRETGGLDAELVDFERRREWEEGLAKFIELAIWRLAASRPDYQPVGAMNTDPDFKHYQGFPQRWSQEVAQLRRGAHTRDNRFYHSGMAQSFLLDRLTSDWKGKIMTPGIFLEDPLRQALSAAD